MYVHRPTAENHRIFTQQNFRSIGAACNEQISLKISAFGLKHSKKTYECVSYLFMVMLFISFHFFGYYLFTIFNHPITATVLSVNINKSA